MHRLGSVALILERDLGKNFWFCQLEGGKGVGW